MPRKPRLNVPGTVAHVMSRCLKSETLFHDDSDRQVFLDILSRNLTQTGYRCYAWALMTNHFHLVVRSSDRDLWELMKPLNAAFANYHKNRHHRDGPLFRDRYKSILTQDQNYIGELVRYVHLNPVRAGICKTLAALERYRWTGHHVLMGNGDRCFQDTSAVLKRFGETPDKARKGYREFCVEGLENKGNGDELVRLVRKSNAGIEAGRKANCWVIGDQAFVRGVLAKADESRLRISRFEKDGGDLAGLAVKISRKFGIEAMDLQRRSRGGKGSEARKEFVRVAVREYGAPSALVAGFCGIGVAAVSAIIRSRLREQVVAEGVVD